MLPPSMSDLDVPQRGLGVRVPQSTSEIGMFQGKIAAYGSLGRLGGVRTAEFADSTCPHAPQPACLGGNLYKEPLTVAGRSA